MPEQNKYKVVPRAPEPIEINVESDTGLYVEPYVVDASSERCVMEVVQ